MCTWSYPKYFTYLISFSCYHKTGSTVTATLQMRKPKHQVTKELTRSQYSWGTGENRTQAGLTAHSSVTTMLPNAMDFSFRHPSSKLNLNDEKDLIPSPANKKQKSKGRALS